MSALITYTPIGYIHSPFTKVEDMPIQPEGAIGISGSIQMEKQYTSALQDLEGFSHIYLLYHFHKSKDWSSQVVPFLDTIPHGLFATRAPKRPNPIGLSIVKLIGIEKNILTIENVDILDGTPLLDIKPYVPAFDQVSDTRIGWLQGLDHGMKTQRSDQRFK